MLYQGYWLKDCHAASMRRVGHEPAFERVSKLIPSASRGLRADCEQVKFVSEVEASEFTCLRIYSTACLLGLNNVALIPECRGASFAPQEFDLDSDVSNRISKKCVVGWVTLKHQALPGTWQVGENLFVKCGLCEYASDHPLGQFAASGYCFQDHFGRNVVQRFIWMDFKGPSQLIENDLLIMQREVSHPPAQFFGCQLEGSSVLVVINSSGFGCILGLSAAICSVVRWLVPPAGSLLPARAIRTGRPARRGSKPSKSRAWTRVRPPTTNVRSRPRVTRFRMAWRDTPRRRAASVCEIQSSGSNRQSSNCL